MKNSISKKKLREFGFLIGFGFPLFIGYLLPAIGGHPLKEWTLWIGIPSIIIALLKPNLLLFPYKKWMALGHILGWINSHIILGLVFLIILQPIALIMRTFGYDPLRKKQINKNSFKEDRKGHKIDLTRIF